MASAGDDTDGKTADLDAQIKEIDEEIKRLYDECVEAGCTQIEIFHLASPILDLVKERKQKRCPRKSLVIYAVLLILFYGVGRIDWTPVVLSSYGRLALIQLLPYWDWTQLYYQDCFVRNPHYVHRRLIEEDCQVCEALDTIPRMKNVSHVEMAEDFLKSDVPAIVTDGLVDWDVTSAVFSARNISKILLDSDLNGDIFPCTFSSNLRLRGENYFRTLLLKLQLDEMENKSWYVHWENCEKRASKALRLSYPRPYFVPPMVDTTEPNWVFLSSHYRGRVHKEVPLLSDMLWLAQLKGSTRIRLSPRQTCNATCLELNDVLGTGEALVFTDRMWILKYLPGDVGNNVAIGGGGSFEI